MTDAKHIAKRYIATWNEQNADRRAQLLRETWDAKAVYVDTMANVTGHDEIAALIGGVQQRFPGFVFTLLGTADGYGDYVRFSWSLGPAGAAAPVEGIDVVMMHKGRIAHVVGFLDKVPQAA